MPKRASEKGGKRHGAKEQKALVAEKGRELFVYVTQFAESGTLAQAEAVERCARAGITDLSDCGMAGAAIDGAPFELLDRGASACELHPWFRLVWSWGSGCLGAGILGQNTLPEPEDCPNEAAVLGKTSAGAIRELSDFGFYDF
jgi:hypothetical protein